MTAASQDAARRIRAALPQLVVEIVKSHFLRRPELEARYGPRGRAKCEEDAAFHLSYLAEAVAAEEEELFRRYVHWAATMLRSRGVPTDDLRENLREVKQVLLAFFPDLTARVAPPADAAIAALDARDEPDVPISDAARRYLEAALHEGPLEAGQVVNDLIAAGMGPAQIYVEVLQPALHEVGRLWQLNKLSPAEEHYCTAVTQRVMARMYSDHVARAPRGPLVVVACVAGDQHELGARMLCDLLELEGYKTDYLGANTPAASLVSYACQRGTRVLALSASTAPQLAAVRDSIAALRADERCRDVKVIVGGAVFSALPSLWQRVGADAWASDAVSAVQAIRRLQPL